MISWPKELTKLLKKAFVQRSSFQRKMSKAFSSFYRDAFNSEAYLTFCTSLYGRSLPQFNLIDSDQWDLFLEELKGIPKRGSDRFLDLGCGMGHNTLEVSKMLKLSGVGVDFSEDAVKKGKKLNINELTDVTFRLGNFHDPFFLQKNEKYKIIFSLDGLYGLKDWEDMLSLLLDRLEVDGKILIFYSSILKEYEEEGPLAKALKSLKRKKNGANFIFRSYDFTKQEEVLLRRTDKLLEDFKASFKREGLDGLYKTKKDECKKGLFWHQKKRTKRLFTVIEKVSF